MWQGGWGCRSDSLAGVAASVVSLQSAALYVIKRGLIMVTGPRADHEPQPCVASALLQWRANNLASIEMDGATLRVTAA